MEGEDDAEFRRHTDHMNELASEQQDIQLRHNEQLEFDIDARHRRSPKTEVDFDTALYHGRVDPDGLIDGKLSQPQHYPMLVTAASLDGDLVSNHSFFSRVLEDIQHYR